MGQHTTMEGLYVFYFLIGLLTCVTAQHHGYIGASGQCICSSVSGMYFTPSSHMPMSAASINVSHASAMQPEPSAHMSSHMPMPAASMNVSHASAMQPGSSAPPTGSSAPPADSSAPPTGSSAPPAGSSKAPAGSSAAPAGSSAPPTGSSAAPAGSSAPPTGSSAAPAGSSAAPAGSSAAPAGSSAPPTGSSAAPTGSSAAPAGSSAPPTGSSAPPAGSSAPPTGSSAPPAGSSAPPAGSSAPPTGSSAPPAGSSAPPTGSSAPPTGSSAPPAGSSIAPVASSAMPPASSKMPPSGSSIQECLCVAPSSAQNVMKSTVAPSPMSSVAKSVDMSSVAKMVDMSSPSPMMSSVAKMVNMSYVAKMVNMSSVAKMVDMSSIAKMVNMSSVAKMVNMSSVAKMVNMSSVAKMVNMSSVVKMINPSSSLKQAPVSSSVALPVVTPNNYTVIHTAGGFKINDIITLPNKLNIAIVNVNISAGQLEIKDASGSSWSELAPVSSSQAAVRPADSFIRYHHPTADQAYFGLVIVEFALTIASSGSYKVTGLATMKKLYILISPAAVVPSFNLPRPIQYVLQEDTSCISIKLTENSTDTHPKGLQVSSFKFDDTEFKPHQHEINEAIFLRYQASLTVYESYIASFWLKAATRGTGRWFYTTVSPKKDFEQSLTAIKKVVNASSFAFCFVPSEDTNGVVTLTVAPAYQAAGQPDIYGTEEVTVTVKINATNDRPKVIISLLDIPALPYNMTGYSNTGFTVAQMLKKTIRGVETSAFTDIDQDTVGVALVSAPTNQYGQWEYKCSGGSWQALDLSYTSALTNVSTLNMILLTPTDYVRFNLQNVSAFWSKREAVDLKISIQALAWDQTDGRSCGSYSHSKADPWPLSFSLKKTFAEGTQLRKGCNGSPGLILKFDSCNKCGGRDECVGCDGVPNSGAIIDICGNCTGGTTNKTFNFRMDCGKTCGDYTFDACQVCVVKGSKENFKDCNADCFGEATINDCGVCVGGATSKPLTEGKDVCGVCNGDGSSCADCSGTPNGLKVIDLCDKCLEPTDATFNTACVKLGTFKPSVAYKSDLPGLTLTLQKSGTISSVTCLFEDNSAATTNAVAAALSGDKKTISVTVPSLNHGKYTLKCTIGSTEKTASTTLFIVDPSAATVTSVAPSIVYHSDIKDVVVTGTDFLDTQQIACLFMMKNSKGEWKMTGGQLPAVYDSATQITCRLPATKKSISGDLVLSFVSSNRVSHTSLKTTLHRSINMSSPNSVGSFSSSLGALIVTFDAPISLKNDSASCADIFPSEASTFGSGAKCKTKGSSLVVQLDGISATFSPGDLNIQLEELMVKRAAYTIYPDKTAKVSIPVPAGAKAPTMEVVAPLKIGRCGDMSVRSQKKEGGGRKLVYKWSIATVPASSGAAKAIIDGINTVLSGYPDFSPSISIPAANFTSSLLNVKFEVSLNITNFLGLSDVFKATVDRENKDLPKLILNKKEITVKASRKVKIKAQVSLPACGGTGDAQVTYLWSLLNEDDTTAAVQLSNTDTPSFKIPPASLIGGKTYKARVDVAMKVDPSMTTFNTVKIIVKSSKLVAKIFGVQSIGSTETLVLSGKDSYDPDGVTTPAPLYLWRITTENDGTVIKGRVEIMKDLKTDVKKLSVDVAKYLKSGIKYKFQLTYQIGGRTATAEQIVSVVAGNPPSLQIKDITEPQDVGSPVRMAAKISSASAVQGKPLWASDNGPEGTLLGDNSGSLYVLGVNTLDESSTYMYTLSVTNVDATATSSITFDTNSSPTPGAMSINPAGGEAFNTPFTIAAAESGGWSDPDGDEVTFEFGYIQNGVEVILGDKQSSKQLEGARLPEGTFDVYVKCCDKYNSCAMKKSSGVIVSAVTVDSAFFDNVNAERIKLKDMQNFAAMAASGVTALDIMYTTKKRRRRRSISSTDCNSLDEATINSQSSALNDHLLPYENGKVEFDPSSRNLFVERIGKFTECGSTILTSTLIARSHTALSAIIGEMVSRTATLVQSDLKTFVNNIITSRYDANQQTAKSIFHSTSLKQTQRMCLGILAGEAAVVAQTSLANLQSYKLTLSSSEAQWTEIGCNGPCTNGEKNAFVDLSTLKSSFGSSYMCGSDQCTGVCLGSIQYPTDIFSKSLNDSMLSTVLEVKLYDPEHALAINITTPIHVDIPIVKETNNSYLCLRWNAASSSWTADDVTSGGKTNRSGLMFVKCSTTVPGPLALFDGPPIQPSASTTTVSSATIHPSQSSNVTMMSSVAPTLSPKDYPRAVKVTFPYTNCTQQKANTLVSTIRTQMAAVINISVSTLTKFNITCGSLVVTYVQVHAGDMSAQDAVTAVQQAASQQKLNITVNGVVITALITVTVTVQTPDYATTTQAPTTTTTTVAPTEDEDDDLSGGAIAGIVIGVIIFVLLLGVIIYFLFCKKNYRKDNAVEPNDNDVELRGKTNQGYDRDGGRGSP